MFINQEIKAEIFKDYSASQNAKDTGSPESQIALFTYRIEYLTQHLKEHPKDNSTKQGLLKLVGKRRALLDYLKRKDIERYRNIINRLGIRR